MTFDFPLCRQGRAADLKFVESVARDIAKVARGNKVVVEKSTVPVKSAQSIADILKANRNSQNKFQVGIGTSREMFGSVLA